MAHLLHDLVLEIPRKDQNVVGHGVVDRLDRVDGDVHAGRVAAMLVRVAIDGEVQEVGADACVVEQSIALPRCAIAADALPFLLGFDEHGQKLALGAMDPSGKINIGREVLETSSALLRQHLDHADRDEVVRVSMGKSPWVGRVSTSISASPWAAAKRPMLPSEKYEKCSW